MSPCWLAGFCSAVHKATGWDVDTILTAPIAVTWQFYHSAVLSSGVRTEMRGDIVADELRRLTIGA